VQATSAPISISIPSFKRKAAKPSEGELQRVSNTFIPPHQLSQADPSLLLAGSLPFSSSSRLRNRDIVLRSTGFLPKNHTEGFHTVSRTTSINNGTSVQGASRTGASASLSGQLAGAGNSDRLPGTSGNLPSTSAQLAALSQQPAPASLLTGAERRGMAVRHQRLTSEALAQVDEISAASGASLRSLAQSIRDKQASTCASDS
jgi:hypothetical protein